MGSCAVLGERSQLVEEGRSPTIIFFWKYVVINLEQFLIILNWSTIFGINDRFCLSFKPSAP